MCGYDGALGRGPADLDAAQMFLAFPGRTRRPGLALCSLNQVLFDLGALGLNADLSVRVSPHSVARGQRGERLVCHLDG